MKQALHFIFSSCTLASLVAAVVSVPLGVWHTAHYNSPGLVLGFFGAIAGCTLCRVFMALADITE